MAVRSSPTGAVLRSPELAGEVASCAELAGEQQSGFVMGWGWSSGERPSPSTAPSWVPVPEAVGAIVSTASHKRIADLRLLQSTNTPHVVTPHHGLYEGNHHGALAAKGLTREGLSLCSTSLSRPLGTLRDHRDACPDAHVRER